MSTKQFLFQILFFFIVLYIESCNGFASMLVDQKASCWIDIRDTKEEVVMNNLINPVHESPHANDVYIEVYDVDRKTPIQIEMIGDKRVVYIHEDLTSSGDFGRNDMVFMNLLLKLNVKDVPELGDLQYVMDAKVFPDEEERGKDANSELTMTAEFPKKSGCNKMRAYGRKGDSGLSFQVGIPSALFSSKNNAYTGKTAIDVVAGWACGHEAVTLTHSIEFRPFIKDSSKLDVKQNNNEVTNEQDIIEGLEEKMIQEVEGEIIKELKEEAETLKDLIEDSELGGGLRARNRHELLHKIQDFKNNHEQHHLLNLKKFNKIYDQSRFGQASFSTTSYITGLVVLLLLAVVVMKCCSSKGKKSKGRRDL